ncbi:MAG: cadherin repeat domain-containing protein [Deltaproteobacteria bacterium]|nr:cadherin repeat domain-containing protein [Deltaproteobacteria bacterium]
MPSAGCHDWSAPATDVPDDAGDGVDEASSEVEADGEDVPPGDEATTDGEDDGGIPPLSALEFLNDQAFVVPDDAVFGDVVGEKGRAWNYEPAGALRYELLGGSGAGHFAIDEASGVVTVASVDGLPQGEGSLDTYTLEVEARDDRCRDTATVTIEVLRASAGNVVFIDPTFDGRGIGTRALPLSSWSGVEWAPGRAYLQRRGTRYDAAARITPPADDVILGAYGGADGPDARPQLAFDVVTSGTSPCQETSLLWIGGTAAGDDVAGVTIRDLELTGSRPACALLFSDVGARSLTIDNVVVTHRASWQGLRLMNTPGVRVLNSVLHELQNHAAYAGSSTLEFAYNHVYLVNAAWLDDPTGSASGDCLSVNDPPAASAGERAVWIHHNRCDRTATGGGNGFLVGTSAAFAVPVVVESNLVEGCLRSLPGVPSQNGIVVDDLPGAFVQRNVLRHLVRGIYLYAETSAIEDVWLTYNVIADTELLAVQFNNGGDGARILNNVFYGYGTGADAVRGAIRTGWSCRLYNNIFFDTAGAPIFSAAGELDADHNLFHPDDGGFGPLGDRSLVADPGFVGAEGLDFHLAGPDSPAVDAGLDVGLATDAEDRRLVGAPDIGAYEYVP